MPEMELALYVGIDTMSSEVVRGGAIQHVMTQIGLHRIIPWSNSTRIPVEGEQIKLDHMSSPCEIQTVVWHLHDEPSVALLGKSFEVDSQEEAAEIDTMLQNAGFHYSGTQKGDCNICRSGR